MSNKEKHKAILPENRAVLYLDVQYVNGGYHGVNDAMFGTECKLNDKLSAEINFSSMLF